MIGSPLIFPWFARKKIKQVNKKDVGKYILVFIPLTRRTVRYVHLVNANEALALKVNTDFRPFEVGTFERGAPPKRFPRFQSTTSGIRAFGRCKG